MRHLEVELIFSCAVITSITVVSSRQIIEARHNYIIHCIFLKASFTSRFTVPLCCPVRIYLRWHIRHFCPWWLSCIPYHTIAAASLVLGRQLVLCLIANAFLCTYPESENLHIETFNFHELFAAFNKWENILFMWFLRRSMIVANW